MENRSSISGTRLRQTAIFNARSRPRSWLVVLELAAKLVEGFRRVASAQSTSAVAALRPCGPPREVRTISRNIRSAPGERNRSTVGPPGSPG